MVNVAFRNLIQMDYKNIVIIVGVFIEIDQIIFVPIVEKNVTSVEKKDHIKIILCV